LRHIMNEFPRPVIVVSAATERDAEVTLNALSIGAFDCVPKQLSDASLEIAHIRSDLVSKIHAAADSRLSRPEPLLTGKPPQPVKASRPPAPSGNAAVVAIASSTGGPRALEQILPGFPADFPLPILIVQHMPAGFIASFAQRLSSRCAINVHEANHHEIVRPGVAYLSPCGVHMRVQRQTASREVCIALDKNRGNALHFPSADLLFASVASVYGNRALGVILTGMGTDGAQGMQAIYGAGGITLGQDEATCTVYGMPRACAELGVLTSIAPLWQIPEQILQATRRRMPA
jgi:two-component system chemotaxis response regulator CheB